MARLILNPKKPGDRAIKGVIFDMDGTLCKPQVSFFFNSAEFKIYALI